MYVLYILAISKEGKHWSMPEETCTPEKKKITGMTYSQLSDWVTGTMEMENYRTSQIFSWVHLRRTAGFDEMTNLSKDLREGLERKASITVLEPAGTVSSEDGTVKCVFRLEDGETVESVLIPDAPRLTACLSTQVGCRCGCTFCQTGISGFQRNLATDEIIGQLYGLQKLAEKRITNVVFMGMGEPMDNFPQVKRSLSIITDDRGICIGARKITISTVGLPGGIEKITRLEGQYGLAVSLHSAVEKTRRELIPVSAALPLAELSDRLVEYCAARRRRVTLEYCLIKGVNDSREEAEALVEFSKRIDCKINLLIYNPVKGSGYRRPDEKKVEEFRDFLYPRCQAVTVRRSRGREIAAACGQLGAGSGSP
ncbi:MAG: 23S rRNA (adenine(2503)-C(2))-methyltransferase RlmN [Candidatus Aegiribacteria sp.]|nr:23S rRNA (adenine(2503)-C(2))-methyltransferase RlmN [Candidatus Aegiribacteria sp.]MBD3294349.1 23S rRNA (adenine(2503)-C(2))-methyltransferase RlmN [Candidatus Fermentibacteria bacterium]